MLTRARVVTEIINNSDAVKQADYNTVHPNHTARTANLVREHDDIMTH